VLLAVSLIGGILWLFDRRELGDLGVATDTTVQPAKSLGLG
jgi:hypothetical protein